MDTHEYLTEIKAKLIALPCVISVVLVEERLLPDRG